MSVVSRFLEAFCRPFASDRECALQVEGQMEKRLDEQSSEELEELTKRLGRSGTPRWRKVVFRLGMVGALMVIAWNGYALVSGPITAIVYAGGMSMPYPFFLPVGFIPHERPGEDFESYGQKVPGVSKGKLLEAAHREADIEGLAAAYLEHVRETRWQADFVETGERLDPDNAWFPLVQAGGSFGYTSGDVLVNCAPASFDKGMALLHQAAEKERCRRYLLDSLQQRAALIPPARTALEQMLRIYLIYYHPRVAEQMVFPAVRAAIVKKAKDLALAGDHDGLRQLASDWKAITRHLASSAIFIRESDEVLKLVVDGGGALIKAATSLGDLQLADQIRHVTDSEALTPFKASFPKGWGFDYGSNLSEPFTTSPTLRGLTDADFIPQRRLNQAIFDRVMAWDGSVAAMLAIGLLSAGFFARPAMVRHLSERLPQLLDRNDHAWIWLGGLGAPAVLYFIISRLTPLGCRDYGILWSDGFPMGGQAGGAVLLSIAMLLEISEWRLSKRARFLEGAGTTTLAGRFVAPMACLLVVVGAGMIRYFKQPEMAWYVYSDGVLHLLVFGIPAACILVRIVRLSFAKGGKSLFRLGVVQVARRGVCGLLVALFATIPLSLLAERHWVTHDPLFDNRAESLGFGQRQLDAVAEGKWRMAAALETK